VLCDASDFAGLNSAFSDFVKQQGLSGVYVT